MCAVLIIFDPKVNAMQTYPFYSSGCLTVRFAGELDHAAAAGAMRAVASAAEEFLPRRCVLDLSGLTFMDSSRSVCSLRFARSCWLPIRRSRRVGCWSLRAWAGF